MNIHMLAKVKRFCHIKSQIQSTATIFKTTICKFSSTTDMSNCDLFKGSEHSKLYSKYRPTYPQELYNTIINCCNESSENKFKFVLDIGCGSGQSCLPLKAHFENVVGIDVSETQIEQAKALNMEGITFKVGSGEDLGFLSNSSVDLVTVAQAMHWIDTDKFYPEVGRILTPGGALVVYGYGNCNLDIEEAQSHLWKFYSGTLQGFWDTRRHHIDNMLSEFILPFPNWKRNDGLYFEKIWSIDDFIGYVSSWSAWHQYLKVYPESGELDSLHKKLKKLYSVSDTAENKVKVTFPVYMLMGKKPIETA